jgi:hypothetical protein
MDQQDAHMQRREEEKSVALADIANALEAITQEHRRADTWERVYLAHALAAVFSGCYRLASTEARLAQTPPDQQSPTPGLPNDPVFNQFDLPLLWKAWNEAKAEPVRQFPHLGPIVLK